MGLILYQRTKGGAFWMRGTVAGQSVRESTKTHDKKAADQIRIKKEAELLEIKIHGKVATVTFAEATNSYLESGGSPRYLGEFKNGKWTGLIGEFGTRLLNTLTQSDLDTAANKLFPSASYKTKNRQCHAPFITVYNHAVRNRWVEPRQWARPRKPKGTLLKFTQKPVRAGTKPVAYDYAAKFVLAMSPAPAMLMTAFFYTGMRPIELFTLEANQVSIKDRCITLESSKSGEERSIPMHEVLVPMFTALCKRGGFIFRTPRGKPYAPKDDAGGQMKTAVNGARKRSGIKDIAPYTGRHSVSTQLVINGVHQFVKDQIMGHAKPTNDMSRHYTNVPFATMLDAINTLPVIEAWANAPWMKDPLAFASKLAEGTGKRSDLERKRA